MRGLLFKLQLKNADLIPPSETLEAIGQRYGLVAKRHETMKAEVAKAQLDGIEKS